MKEQNKYDQIPPGLLGRLQRILPLTEKVVDKMICEETEILEEIIPRMFEVMHRVAMSLCEYVKRGRFGGQPSFLNLASAYDRSEGGGWAGPPGDDRRVGWRVDQGH